MILYYKQYSNINLFLFFKWFFGSDQEAVGSSEPPKRQRRWNSETIKVPEQASNLGTSSTPKDAFQPTPRRIFPKSDSKPSGDAQKERIGEIKILHIHNVCVKCKWFYLTECCLHCSASITEACNHFTENWQVLASLHFESSSRTACKNWNRLQFLDGPHQNPLLCDRMLFVLYYLFLSSNIHCHFVIIIHSYIGFHLCLPFSFLQ